MTTRPSSQAERTFNPWVVLTLVCMAQFMVILDATVVNVALPSIKRGLSFSNADLQWIVNAYTLTFGGFLLLGGRAGDLFGRQRIFLAGLVIFSLSSLVNGIAQSPTMLIVGRAVQGFGGALISPLRCRSSPPPSRRVIGGTRRLGYGARSPPAVPHSAC